MDRVSKPKKEVGQDFLHAVPAGLTCPAGETGMAWREKRPVWDRQRCFKCGMCWLSCPDGAIEPDGQGYYGSMGIRCKGCGICEAACLNEAITMTPEQAPAGKGKRRSKVA